MAGPDDRRFSRRTTPLPKRKRGPFRVPGSFDAFNPRQQQALAKAADESAKYLAARKRQAQAHAKAVHLYKQGHRLEAIKMNEAAGLGGRPKGLEKAVLQGTKDVLDIAYNAPGGIVELGKAPTKDLMAVKPKRFGGKGDLSFKRSRALGKAMAVGTYEDLRHPLRHPGYTLSDVLALGTAGASGVSRVAAAGKAIKAGEGVGRAIARPGHAGGSLLHKPIARETTLRQGDLTVHRLEPDNPLLRPLHRARTKRLQKQIDQPIQATTAIGKLHERVAGAHNAIGRELRAGERITTDLAKAPAQHIERVSSKLNAAEKRALDMISVEGKYALTRPEEVVSRHAATHRAWASEGIEPRLNNKIAKRVEAALPVLKAPSPAFLDAVRQTMKLSQRSEKGAVKEGLLTPEIALEHKAQTAHAYSSPHQGAPPGSFYYPRGEWFKINARPQSMKAYSPQPGPYGLGEPQAGRYTMGTLRRSTGQGMKRGVVENPAQALAQAEIGRQRLYSVKRVIGAARKAATDTKTSEWQIPIREKTAISPELHRTIDGLLAKAKNGDEAALHKAGQQIEDALKANEHADKGIGTKIKGVKWVDSRILKSTTSGSSSGIAKFARGFNRPFRFFGVYVRPAYFMTNYPQNAAMLAFQHGARIVPHFKTAMRAEKVWGPDLTAWVESGMGTTRTEAFLPRGKIAGAERKVVGFLTNATDRHARLAALSFRAAERGFKGKAGLQRLRNDPALEQDRIAVFRRARKDAVDFDSMTPEEKALVDAVYFYPWMSRATAWSGRAVLNHPIKTAALAQSGRIGQTNLTDTLGPVPRWMKGYIPTAKGLVNTRPLNTLSTPAEILDFFAHPKDSSKRASFFESFGTPAVQMGSAQNLASIPGDLIGSTAPGLIAKRLGVDMPWLLGRASKTFPGTDYWDAAGPYAFGAWWPRKPDRSVVQKSALKDMKPTERVTFQTRNLPKELLAAAKQANIPVKKIPPELLQEIKLDGARQKAYAQVKEKKGSLSPVDRFASDVNLLVKMGTGTPAQAKEAIAWAKTATPSDLQKARNQVSKFFPKTNLNHTVKVLKDRGVKVSLPSVR